MTFFRGGGLQIELLKKMFFSVISKNLKREILTKNLVIFKRWDEVKGERF